MHNNNQPLVSIIMNCYNGETYLRESINSVLEQTYENWELIFWDNRSEDQSAEIFKSYIVLCECINKIRERRWNLYEFDDDYLDTLESTEQNEDKITTLISSLLDDLSFVDRNIMLLRYRTCLDF